MKPTYKDEIRFNQRSKLLSSINDTMMIDHAIARLQCHVFARHNDELLNAMAKAMEDRLWEAAASKKIAGEFLTAEESYIVGGSNPRGAWRGS